MNDERTDCELTGHHSWDDADVMGWVCVRCGVFGRDCPECCGHGSDYDGNECQRCSGEEVVAD